MIEQTLDENMLKMAKVQQQYEKKVLSMPNVVGVALGNRIRNHEEIADEPVITVLVNQKVASGLLSEDERVLPDLDGKPTDVVEIGDIFAGDSRLAAPVREDETPVTVQTGFSASLTSRIRPAMGGFSVGHREITAGTLGICCRDLNASPGGPPRYYILSNNHVLANSNYARIGDPILQPAPSDGGRFPKDVIARLSRFVPIQFIRSSADESVPYNFVDAAIAEGNLLDLDRQIYWAGYVKGINPIPKIGDVVQKTGRTTGFTTGKVTNVNATVLVNYGWGKVAKFCHQIITSNMSSGGDSGSLVIDSDEKAVGLLFAGSAKRSIINNIQYVQELLGIKVTEK